MQALARQVFGTTSGVRSSERDPNTAIPAGAARPATGHFFCPMVPDPQVQIDLRDQPRRVASAPVPRFASINTIAPKPARPALVETYDWRADPLYDPSDDHDDDPDTERLLDEDLDPSDDAYLAEDRAELDAAGELEDGDEEDDPLLLAERAYAAMIAAEQEEDADA